MTIIKNKKKLSKRKHVEDIKIFVKKKKKKSEKRPRKISKFLTEEEKEKKGQDHCERNENLSEEKSRT